MSEKPIEFGQATLTDCDREPIHIPGSIQPHGALLVLEPGSLRVLEAAGDTAGLLGADIAALLNGSLADRLPHADCAKLAGLNLSDGKLTRPHHIFSFRWDGRLVDALAQASGDALLLELEPQLESDPDDSLGLVQDMIGHVQKARTPEACYETIVDAVRSETGFDRVMLYRFLEDGCGSVEAEARGDDVPSFLGLRYPASDIPRQARALYLQNWIRVIPDARYRPSPILRTTAQAATPPRDLSHSVLRSVSPIHLEYLANMGVVASMSLSIIIDGALWGLIACHHRSPRFPTYRRRVALELFAQMASFQLETKLEAEALGSRLRQKNISEELIAALSGEAELEAGLRRFQPRLLQYIQAAGVAIWADGKFNSAGNAIGSEERAGLVRWLNETTTQGVFHTDRLSDLYPPATAFADKASGILALSVSRTPRDYVIWLRPELVQTVAGIRASLPAPDRARLGIIAGNYGAAGALDLYGPAAGSPGPAIVEPSGAGPGADASSSMPPSLCAGDIVIINNNCRLSSASIAAVVATTDDLSLGIVCGLRFSSPLSSRGD